MNLLKELGDESCLFCSKNADESRLIQINIILLKIGSESIAFPKIIYDVVQRKIKLDRINYICDYCSNLIIKFYLFRNCAQKNVNLIEVNSVIAKQVQFIEEIETENITILKTEQIPLISLNKEINNDNQELPFDENLDSIKDKIASEHEQDVNELEKYENQQNSTLEPYFKPRQKISDLQPNELALRFWCSRQAESQKTIIKTKQGTHFQWSCSKCNFFSNSLKYFMEHLNSRHSTMADDDYIDLNKYVKSKKQKHTYTPQQLKMKNLYAEQMKSQVFINKTPNSEVMQWSCSQCSYITTTSANAFGNHMRTKHFNEKVSTFNKHSCKKCCINYQTISQSRAHQKIHEFLDVIASYMSFPECEQCRVIFCNINDLNAHLIAHKSPIFSHKPIPSIGYMVKQVQHVETESKELLKTNEESLWKCGHCIKKFDDKLECFKHQLLFHVVIFVCPFDNQEFKCGKIVSYFRFHVRKSHKQIFQNIDIKCSYCELTFEDEFLKLSHMKECVEKKFECDYCSKKFFRKYLLVNHIYFHVGINIITCDVGGKISLNPNHSKIHMRSHSSSRAYECGLCDKKYSTISGRTSHMEIHGVTDIVCPVCSFVFKQRCSFLRHYNAQHNDAFRKAKFKKLTCKMCSMSFLQHHQFVHHMKSIH